MQTPDMPTLLPGGTEITRSQSQFRLADVGGGSAASTSPDLTWRQATPRTCSQVEACQ